MTRIDAINGAAAVAALALTITAAAVASRTAAPPPSATPTSKPPDAAIELVALANGHGVIDASGVAVPVGDYRRVASASSVSDWILAELCGASCVVAYTERAATGAPWRHRLAGRATIAGLADLEPVIALRPDLVLVDSYGDPRRTARLREHGLPVFDLGQMRGAHSAARAIRTVGALLDRGARAEQLAGRYLRSLRSIARDRPGEPRRAAYVSPFGSKLFGGTTGTAYHDILRYAGLADVAAARFDGFLEYSAEQLLVLDPPLIVTRAGGGEALCRRPGLDALRACREPARIVELDAFALDDPGLGILESAEALYHAVYGSRTP